MSVDLDRGNKGFAYISKGGDFHATTIEEQAQEHTSEEYAVINIDDLYFLSSYLENDLNIVGGYIADKDDKAYQAKIKDGVVIRAEHNNNEISVEDLSEIMKDCFTAWDIAY